ncbi:hypothetical protein WISP_142567 [Willisornis vidua]|uniref:Uncharacterized protein n=1 Tax=Willisornis vidua TaxID=1566151 RepID=A0ABQ9CR30_9PASS|nr:hypothetical protein WISP_142567 [Willisornis vidua]
MVEYFYHISESTNRMVNVDGESVHISVNKGICHGYDIANSGHESASHNHQAVQLEESVIWRQTFTSKVYTSRESGAIPNVIPKPSMPTPEQGTNFSHSANLSFLV